MHVVVFLGELSGVVIIKALISPLVFHRNVIDVLELLLVRSIALYSFDRVFLDRCELLKFSLFGLRCLWVAENRYLEAKNGSDHCLQVNDFQKGRIIMDTWESAPHLVEKSPFVTFNCSCSLAHQAKAYRELSILRVTEDRVLIKVLGLHDQRSHHYELSGQFIREIEFVTHLFILLFHELLFVLLLFFLVFRVTLLLWHPLQVLAGLSDSNSIGLAWLLRCFTLVRSNISVIPVKILATGMSTRIWI